MEKEMPVLKLKETVVSRTVPMTAQGCDMLRSIRDFQQARLERQQGVVFNIPFPTVIHILMLDFCKQNNIEVENVRGEAT